MPGQTAYYNRFGETFGPSILACPEPHLWTTDYAGKGRIYREMQERIATQQALIQRHFQTGQPVVDIGCGFGRQAYLLAKNGFAVTGTDTSPVFVSLAQALFKKHGLPGRFLCMDIAREPLAAQFPQALLLDVLEHVSPAERKAFVSRLAALLTPGGRLLLSLPRVKSRLSSRLNNRVRKAITGHFAFFRNREEHPYPIPERRDILRLTAPFFSLLEEQRDSQTAYFVLQRLPE